MQTFFVHVTMYVATYPIIAGRSRVLGNVNKIHYHEFGNCRKLEKLCKHNNSNIDIHRSTALLLIVTLKLGCIRSLKSCLVDHLTGKFEKQLCECRENTRNLIRSQTKMSVGSNE